MAPRKGKREAKEEANLTVITNISLPDVPTELPSIPSGPLEVAAPSPPAVQEEERPKTPQARILEAVRAAEELQEPSPSPVTERRTEIHMSGQRSHTGSAVDLANASLVETPPVESEVEVESAYVNVIPATSTL